MLNADEIFRYNKNATFEENFRFWYELNCIEREAVKEKKLSIEEALQVFEKQYKNYIDNTKK